MFSQLARLGLEQLQRIGASLRAGRPLDTDIGVFGEDGESMQFTGELNQLVQSYGAEGAAKIMELLAEQHQNMKASHSEIDLVWSGPDLKGVNNRDTGTAVRTLFRGVAREAIVCGYAIYAGRDIFHELAIRMDEHPGVRVTMLLDIRPEGDDKRDRSLRVEEFAAEFKARHWPGKRLPDVYFDPRSFEKQPERRAALHAKFVVVDRAECLVSSANFTPAAQDRNIEAGVLIRSAEFASRLANHVDQLISTGCVLRAM